MIEIDARVPKGFFSSHGQRVAFVAAIQEIASEHCSRCDPDQAMHFVRPDEVEVLLGEYDLASASSAVVRLCITTDVLLENWGHIATAIRGMRAAILSDVLPAGAPDGRHRLRICLVPVRPLQFISG